jgi:hypothetical protein
MLPPEQRLDRLETLVARGATSDAVARAALLGTVKRPAFLLSKLFEEYEVMTKDEVRDFSPNQLRVWRNSGMREYLQQIASRPSRRSNSPGRSLLEIDGLELPLLDGPAAHEAAE